MRDVLEMLVLVLLGFPFGVGLAAFLRWISRQKDDPSQRQAVAEGWLFIGRWGTLFNLVMALWKATERDPNGVERSLTLCAFFVSVSLGAWAETRRFLRASEVQDR